MSKDLKATIGINTKETGKVDRHALKRVSGACARPRNFSNHDENGHRFRKTEFLFKKPVVVLLPVLLHSDSEPSWAIVNKYERTKNKKPV